jgi:glycyl-tRNA synthetase
MKADSLEPIVNLCKRRGFVVGSSEIYGGIASLFDFGPLGVELKNNLKQLWWKTFIQERDDMVGLDSSIIMHPRVWEASGHLESLTDPLVECKKCHFRFREDHIPGEDDKKFWQCPEGDKHEFSESRQFNLLVKTFLGATEDAQSMAYLRGETAQGMFTDFKYILESSRQKVPFGVGQIGKSFRNEIGLGNWLFRLREFEIAELEYFVKPGTDDQHFTEWVAAWKAFYERCGISLENIRDDVKAKEDLAHYSKGTIDFEYKYPFGWGELGAVANRTDYDLKRHAEYSGSRVRRKVCTLRHRANARY